jgi:hypothetical protein
LRFALGFGFRGMGGCVIPPFLLVLRLAFEFTIKHKPHHGISVWGVKIKKRQQWCIDPEKHCHEGPGDSVHRGLR